MKHLPFLDGKYSVAPALLASKKTEGVADKKVFQIDERYAAYIANKKACREEDIYKYYFEKNLDRETLVRVNQLIAEQLIKEYPEHFHLQQQNDNYLFTNKLTNEILKWKNDWIEIESQTYVSLYDALACQVQEDFAICQLQGNKDWMAALHICSPNHWEPAEKAGRPFDAIHTIVPGMEKTMPHYFKMLQLVVNKGPFTRFAWGIATDDRLNHHPVAAPGYDAEMWKGRKIAKGCELYVRVERQSLTGLPDVNAFFFTIRTYFYKVEELEKHEKMALITAVETMSAPSLTYKGLAGKVDIVRQIINDKK